MQFNFNNTLNIDLISNPELYEKIKRCQSEEELLTTLGRDHKDLLFVLGHLPIIDASNHTFIAKVVSLTTEGDRVRLKEVEKTLLGYRLDDELTETIQARFSEFQSAPIPNIHRLTHKLREAVINIAFQHSKSRPIKETLEKADRLIEQTATEQGIRIIIKPQEFLSAFTEQAFKKAGIAFERQDPKEQRESIQELKELMRLLLIDFKAENLPKLPANITQKLVKVLDDIKTGLVSKPPLNFERTQQLGQDFKMVAELTKFLTKELKEQPELVSKISEVANAWGDRFIAVYDYQHIQLVNGTDISPEQKKLGDELRSLLLFIQNDLPAEWELQAVVNRIKQHIVDGLNSSGNKRIDAIMRSSNYDPIQQNVISTFPVLNNFLENPTPAVEDFVECYDLVNQLLWEYREALARAKNVDIVLDTYISIARDLVNKTSLHIQSTLDRQGINLSNPSNRATRRTLERVLEQTPPLVGTHIELEIKMDVDQDPLITLLYSKLSKTARAEEESLMPQINRWVSENPQYDLKGFQGWLESVPEEQCLDIGHGTGCEEVYCLYLSTLLS